MFSNLQKAMSESNITNAILAKILGVSEKTVYNKLSGSSEWTWPEAKTVSALFPKYSMEWLFATEEKTA